MLIYYGTPHALPQGRCAGRTEGREAAARKGAAGKPSHRRITWLRFCDVREPVSGHAAKATGGGRSAAVGTFYGNSGTRPRESMPFRPPSEDRR